MSVQTFLHCLEGLFNVAIPLQQLTHKEAHLILEILRDPVKGTADGGKELRRKRPQLQVKYTGVGKS